MSVSSRFGGFLPALLVISFFLVSKAFAQCHVEQPSFDQPAVVNIDVTCDQQSDVALFGQAGNQVFFLALKETRNVDGQDVASFSIMGVDFSILGPDVFSVFAFFREEGERVVYRTNTRPVEYLGGTGDDVTISGELRRWHKLEFTLDAPFSVSEQDSNNPFRNYRFDMIFTHPGSGISHRRPGYFAADGNAAESGAVSGNKWVATFAPDKVGTWNYQVSFRQGNDVAVSLSPTAGSPVSGLDGLSGSFVVGATNKSGRDFRAHGRLEYVNGMRYYRHAGSQEFFIKVGADSPENFLGYYQFDNTRDHGGIGNNLQDGLHRFGPHVQHWNNGPVWHGNKGKGIIGAVNYLVSKGMNSIYFLTMNVNGDGREVYPWTSYGERYRYDVSKLAQWEIVFNHMDTNGVVMHLVTQETENNHLLDNGNLGTQRKLYLRELVARFGHHLAIFWNLGEENTQSMSQRRDMARHIQDLTGNKALVAVHSYPDEWDTITPYGDNNFTGTCLQSGITGSATKIETQIADSEAAGRVLMADNCEQNPAGTGVKPDGPGNNHKDIREHTLWGTLLSGGGGVEYYYGYQFAHDDLDCEDWSSRSNMWDYTKVALDFFKQHFPGYPLATARNDMVSHTSRGHYAMGLENVSGLPDMYAILYRGTHPSNPDYNDLSIKGVKTGTYTVRWYDAISGGSLQEGSKNRVTSSGPNDSVNIGFFYSPEHAVAVLTEVVN